MFLALSDDVKQTVLMHADSTASVLVTALRDQYEHTGVSSEFYVKQDFESAKLSNFNSIRDFIIGLTNFTHIYNKEVKGDARHHIEECDIMMRILHSLPPCLCTLQTLLIRTMPTTDETVCNVSELKQIVTNKKT